MTNWHHRKPKPVFRHRIPRYDRYYWRYDWQENCLSPFTCRIRSHARLKIYARNWTLYPPTSHEVEARRLLQEQIQQMPSGTSWIFDLYDADLWQRVRQSSGVFQVTGKL